ncbi:Uu.00g017060.m01.CDS01 [Anthostomella pinea]|uniref:Uu.00g017060.m01.CDS01 n=1 Tax=Anthostomella pinea TaxID=933095 RepID=A0AAI8VYU9_9PEZI|nr:Uu.00g017060.m01.CDS01 [Anthostomella pinea]
MSAPGLAPATICAVILIPTFLIAIVVFIFFKGFNLLSNRWNWWPKPQHQQCPEIAIHLTDPCGGSFTTTESNFIGQVKKAKVKKDNGIESFNDGPDRPLTVVKKRRLLSRTKDKDKENRRPSDESHLHSEAPSWDAATPKPMNRTSTRHLSSIQPQSTSSPTQLSGLRWLSSSRTPSTKTTHRRSDLRLFSGSSYGSSIGSLNIPATGQLWDHRSASGSTELSFALDELNTCGRPPTSNSFFGSATTDGSICDPYMLVPHISITPEIRTLEEGQSSVWAAIKISGQLSSPGTEHTVNPTPNASNGDPCFMPVHHGGAALSQYGYLYDLRVDILPTAQSTIIDQLDDNLTRTIKPGSSMLVLAHIRLSAPQPQRYKGTPEDESNDLIADLEYQLGGVRAKYLQVRVKYCHSGFPALKQTSLTESVSTCETRLETAATGVIERRSSMSAWSPRLMPSCNPLLGIIASHWGPVRATEVFRKIVAHRTSPQLPDLNSHMDTLQARELEDTIATPISTRKGPPVRVPRRQASLGRASPDDDVDPARKIWTEMRRTSGGKRPNFHVSKPNRSPAATTYALSHKVSKPELPQPKTEIERQREMIRDTALRNKRSIGADSLKSLVPSMADVSLGGKENSDPFNPPHTARRQDMHFDGRKRDGRWSLGGWW